MVATLSLVTKDDILTFLSQHKAALEKAGIGKIGLYGSFAKDTADIYSDIDIAIQLKKNYLSEHDAWDYFTLIDHIKTLLSKKFTRKCDVLDLDSDSFIINTIKDEIIYV